MNLEKFKHILKRFIPIFKWSLFNILLIIVLSASLFLLYGKNESYKKEKRKNDNLKSEISSLEASVSNLNNQIEELEYEIENCENENTNLEDELDECKNNLNNQYYY